MIQKLLIANRGEIACRVIKTAKQLGIQTVAVYSQADCNAMHVNMADEAVLLGPAPSKDSYLKYEAIISHAKNLRVDAIHPGYGFLSENADFAQQCEANNLVFVGPPASAIQAMGSKSAAKRIMEDAGVPLVPGYHGDDQTPATLKKAADDMGYPVLLKAAAGGGGKGMRQVWHEDEFYPALQAAKRESMASFGDDHMLVEKYLTRPRHVEIQVFCDTFGQGVYLFERDCSVQRRHQKIIEEAPAPNMPEGVREQMGEAALKAASAIHYVGAGTVEFLLDDDGAFYFMEMNTRLQVEHPVTEMITGEDLVAWQLQVADKKPLPKTQAELKCQGHAFEARIYAEDADNDFLPSTGHLALLKPPATNAFIRVDTGVTQGDDVSVYYDPMIAKLVVWGENRELALSRLYQALGDYHISGVTTNIPFLRKVANSQAFKQAELTTTFIDKFADQLTFDESESRGLPLPAMALYVLLDRASNEKMGRHVSERDHTSPWQQLGTWRANSTYEETLSLEVNNHTIRVEVQHIKRLTVTEPRQWRIKLPEQEVVVSGSLNGNTLQATIGEVKSAFTVVKHNSQFSLLNAGICTNFQLIPPELGLDGSDSKDTNTTAPMNGTIVAHLVPPEEHVKRGDPLLIMEAMKMEHTITAPSDGKVDEYYYAVGELVDGGAALFAFTPHTTD